MKSLSQFQGYSPVFHEPASLPEFFKTNLLNPARVVKAFINDPQGHIRIFYYQYLKLCFELQNINYDYYIRKFEQTINSDFHFIFYPDDDPTLFNDMQAISLVMEFFGILGEGQLNVQAALNQYPIMDYIFVHFFRSLLILTDKTDSLDSYLSRDEILGFLCPEFGVAIQIHSECIKYVETDIFVYEENPKAIYMAYMEYNEQNVNNHDNSTSVQPNESLPISNQLTQVETTEKIEEKQINIPSHIQEVSASSHRNSYIASQFMDFTTYSNQLNTSSKAPQSSIPSFIKPQLNEREDPSKNKINNTHSELIYINNTTNFTPSNEASTIKPSSKINEQITSQQNYPQNIPSPLKDMHVSHQSQYSPYDPFKYQPNQDNPPYKSTSSNIFYESKKEPFYNPTQNIPYNNGIINPAFGKKKNFGLNVSQEFTNSIIMKSMAEPFRSNVHNMRMRARNFRDSLNRQIK